MTASTVLFSVLRVFGDKEALNESIGLLNESIFFFIKIVAEIGSVCTKILKFASFLKN